MSDTSMGTVSVKLRCMVILVWGPMSSCEGFYLKHCLERTLNQGGKIKTHLRERTNWLCKWLKHSSNFTKADKVWG